MMLNVLFLGGIYPEPYKDAIFKNSKRGYQFAAQNLQEGILKGFIENRVDLSILTQPFLSTFPFGYKRPIVHYQKCKYFNLIDTKCITFINIPFVSSFLNSGKLDISKWCKGFTEDEEKHIIVYSLTVKLMELALYAKRNFRNVKISIIIPDLPQYMGCNTICKFLGLQKKSIRFIDKNLKKFDNFILLTESMAKPLGIECENYCVVEGIFNNKSIAKEDEGCFDSQNKILLYSGALVAKYGIETLLNAFTSLSNHNYRLVICGDGEAKDFIESVALKDKRVIYMGKVAYEKVLAMQKEASLLINPRTADGEYTKYSFPSKTMEYFASGTAVLMYRLPGIPLEYFDYCFTLTENSQEALAHKIDEILSISEPKRTEIGTKAAKFILEEKNAMKQISKVIKLIH